MQPIENQQPELTQRQSRIEKARVKDPVCGMEVVSGESEGGNATHDGETYDFCSEECRERFQANPGAWVAPH
jgi:YHS domain-containing protein